jgi:hypothetical protein
MADDQKTLDGYRFLAQIHRQERWERAKHEWKLVIEAFALYAALLAAVLAKQSKLVVPCWGYAVIWILTILLILCFAGLLALIQHGHCCDLSIAERAEDNIRALLGEDIKWRATSLNSRPRFWKRVLYVFLQALMFALFAIAVTFLFTWSL